MGHRLWKMRLLVLLMASCLVATTTADLTVIQEDEWRQLLKGEWMVEFAAPWCPACRALQPTWEEFAGWSEDLEVGVGQVDVTASPGLSGRFMVTALPTIFHVKDGVFRQYRSGREWSQYQSGRAQIQCRCPSSPTSSSCPWSFATSTLSSLKTISSHTGCPTLPLLWPQFSLVAYLASSWCAA